MIDLGTIHNVYLLGIGGIGMSALARYFHTMGKDVAGYDLTPSSITDDLSRLGIRIHFEDDISQLPEKFKSTQHTLVVRTPAVPDTHKEYQYFVTQHYQILKRSEVLGQLFNYKRGIAIAGTHGKTSVSSMTAYLMDGSALGCNAFLGGIVKNIQSNLILNSSSEFVVAEADEFDRSFLQLKPEISLVTWVDADHLDIYDSEDDISTAFTEFLDQTKKGGTIILKKGIDLDFSLKERMLYTYSLKGQADFYAENIECIDSKYSFDLVTPDNTIQGIKLQTLGITNVENAVAAGALAWAVGVESDDIRKGLSGFLGVKRRFDLQYLDSKLVYIDDYAHHPRELDAVIGSVRKLFPGKKILGIFQPHLYSRTRDFADEFAKSLSALDELILLDIYPAREKPIEGVSSESIFRHVTIGDREICSKEDLLGILKKKKIEVLLTMGAGDIDRFVKPIKKMLEQK